MDRERLYRETERKKNEMSRELHRTLTADIRAVEGEDRTIELSFSSEEPYQRWWGTEILDHTEGCMDLKRLKEIGCVLFNHNRDAVIAGVVNAWNEGERGHAKIRFDEDMQSDVIYQKVLKGTLKGVSVGYLVSVWEKVSANRKSLDGRFNGPCEIAKKWMPFEISVVSVPADATVGVGRQMETGNRRGRTLDYYSRQLQYNENHLGGKSRG